MLRHQPNLPDRASSGQPPAARYSA
jgi:hypothetical protein